MIRPSNTASRAAIAAACSLILALPTAVRAREPAPAPPAGVMTDELPLRAEEHVVKALQQFEANAFGDAEASFKRAAFFAPDWRPLHFNLGVLAEAQGQLGVAVREYQTFKPFATPDEGMLVDQRISELDDRRKRIASAYRKQIATSAIAMSLGVGILAGGGVLIGLAVLGKKKVSDSDGKSEGEPGYLTTDQIAAQNSKDSKYAAGAYIMIVVGALAVAYAFIPLSRSLKSKRQLEGLALGRTRLQWTGGAGVRLRF